MPPPRLASDVQRSISAITSMASTLESLPSIIHRYEVGIGAWLIGSFVTALVFGMTLLLTFSYFRLYPSDPLYMKLWVTIPVTLQAVTLVVIIRTCYFFLVSNAFNVGVFIVKDVWSTAIIPVFGAINALISESFFARRVYLIGPLRYKLVAASGMLTVLGGCAFFITVSIDDFTSPEVQSEGKFGSWPPAVGVALLLAGDLQLTAVLVYFFYQCRSGIRQTNSMVDILIACTISTGAIICILNLATLIVAVATMPHNIIYAAISIVLQSVYTGSFIVALNTRRFVRSRGELGDTDIGGAAGFVFGEGGSRPAAQANPPMTSLMFAEQPSSHTQFSSGEVSTTTTSTKPEALDTSNRSWDNEGKERDLSHPKLGLATV
ncbi:hypothetical protein C8Q77DRAFT_1079225 [Trametes polyzona]|nr:hypothetical protein C8Q77DRAFT_1079225 [Trametes polyzona]